MNRLLQTVIPAVVMFALLAAGVYLTGGMRVGDMFMPHSHCYLLNPALMKLHGGSDLLIGFSYVSISATLVWLVFRARRDLPFHWIMIAFAIFIVACGATHFMEVWTLTDENPKYWLSGWVKLVTAIASVTTAVVLPPLIPRIRATMEAARVSAERGRKLESAYAELNELYTKLTKLDLMAELDAAKTAAETANSAKDNFLAVLSHELRTPLTPALAASSTLLTTPEFTSDARVLRDWLEIIHRNIELEARLVDDLLDVTRITRGKLRIQSTPVDIHSIVLDALRMAEPALGEKKIVTTLNLADARPFVRGDAARLAQVFANLLMNAAKFTPDGGRVTLRSIIAGGAIQIGITDTGIGIEPEMLAKVFDPFCQGQAGTTRRFGGLGLGLSVAKGLVEAHDGTIRAESAGNDHGATFIVTLPTLADNSAPATPPHPPSSSASVGRSLHILLVEDHEDTLTVLRRLITRTGHTITTASSLAEARSAIAAESFDLLLSDLGLPDGSGLDVVAALRAKSNIPAVAMSGFGMEADLARSREAGFTEHIVKPVSVDDLRNLLKRYATSTP